MHLCAVLVLYKRINTQFFFYKISLPLVYFSPQKKNKIIYQTFNVAAQILKKVRLNNKQMKATSLNILPCFWQSGYPPSDFVDYSII